MIPTDVAIIVGSLLGTILAIFAYECGRRDERKRHEASRYARLLKQHDEMMERAKRELGRE